MPGRNLRILLLTVLFAAFPPAQLMDMGYSIASLEVLAVTAIFAIAGLLLGLVISRQTLLYSAVLALALAIFASVYWISDARLEMLATVVAVLAVPLIIKRYEQAVLPGALAFFLFWSVSLVFQPAKLLVTPPLPEPAAAASTGPPPFIHIILDEQMSPLTLPDSIPPGHPANGLLKSYLDRGFDIHARATSSSEDTRASISALMSLENDMSNHARTAGPYTWSIVKNAEQIALATAGYRIVGLQSDYLNFCTDSPSASCHTHTRADSLQAMSKPGLGSMFRIGVAFLALDEAFEAPRSVRAFLFYTGLKRYLARFVPPRYFERFSRSAAMIDILADVKRTVAGSGPGQAYILHIMLPHFPYLLDADCNVKPVAMWRSPPRYDRLGNRQSVYQAYWDQSVCANRQVIELVDRVLSAPFGQRAIIMVHGDHGSRFGRKTDDADMLENRQTLLAVKTPATTGKLFEDEVSLQLQFAEQFRAAIAQETTSAAYRVGTGFSPR